MKAPVQDSALFSVQQRARARRSDPVTSVFAAMGIDCTRRQAMVLTAFIGFETATHDQLIDAARERFGDVAESTIRTGCSELEEMGWVERVGIGLSKRGHKCGLYKRVIRRG